MLFNTGGVYRGVKLPEVKMDKDPNFYYITDSKRRHKDTNMIEVLVNGKWLSEKIIDLSQEVTEMPDEVSFWHYDNGEYTYMCKSGHFYKVTKLNYKK